MTFAVLDHLLDLGLYRFEVERSRSLHRRKLNRGLCQLADVLLNHHEAPEFSGVEVVAITEGTRVRRLAADTGRALKRVLANIDHDRG